MTLHKSSNLAKYTINANNPYNPDEFIIHLRGIYYLAVKKTLSDGFQDHEYLDISSISPCVHALYVQKWGKK